jgi:hypothetical protein
MCMYKQCIYEYVLCFVVHVSGWLQGYLNKFNEQVGVAVTLAIYIRKERGSNLGLIPSTPWSFVVYLSNFPRIRE